MEKQVRLCEKAEVAPGEMRRLALQGLPPLAAFFNVRTWAALPFPSEKPLKTCVVTAVGEDLFADVE